jgi:GTPase
MGELVDLRRAVVEVVYVTVLDGLGLDILDEFWTNSREILEEFSEHN